MSQSQMTRLIKCGLQEDKNAFIILSKQILANAKSKGQRNLVYNIESTIESFKEHSGLVELNTK